GRQPASVRRRPQRAPDRRPGGGGGRFVRLVPGREEAAGGGEAACLRRLVPRAAAAPDAGSRSARDQQGDARGSPGAPRRDGRLPVPPPGHQPRRQVERSPPRRRRVRARGGRRGRLVQRQRSAQVPAHKVTVSLVISRRQSQSYFVGGRLILGAREDPWRFDACWRFSGSAWRSARSAPAATSVRRTPATARAATGSRGTTVRAAAGTPATGAALASSR